MDSNSDYNLVYTDGCLARRKGPTIGGWAFYMRNQDASSSKVVGGKIFADDCTRLELLAIASAMELVEAPVTIITDRADLFPTIKAMIESRNCEDKRGIRKNKKYDHLWQQITSAIAQKPKNYFSIHYLHSDQKLQIGSDEIWPSLADHKVAHEAAMKATYGRL